MPALCDFSTSHLPQLTKDVLVTSDNHDVNCFTRKPMCHVQRFERQDKQILFVAAQLEDPQHEQLESSVVKQPSPVQDSLACYG